MELSIIVPCYNESSRSGVSLTDRVYSLRNYLFSECFDFEIILVSDGSYDGTSSEIDKLANSLPDIKRVCYKGNKGKGYAIKEGSKVVSKSVTLIMDADLGVSIKNIKVFYSEFKSVVIGARKSAYNNDSSRKTLSILSKFCMQKILGLTEKDTQCGFKMIKSDILKDFCINFQHCDKWLFDAELLVYLHQNHIDVMSIDVDWNNGKDTRVKVPSGIVTSIFELLRIFTYKKDYKTSNNSVLSI